MTPFMVLENYMDFLTKLVTEKDYRLTKAPPLDQPQPIGKPLKPLEKPKEPILVLPRIAIGNMPHANFDPYETDKDMFQAPYAVIGMGEYTDDDNDASMPILIQVCCYPEVPYEKSGDLRVPDNLAYLDVINFLTFMKYHLLQQRVFGDTINRTAMQKPIKMGTYADKQYTYPFAFGYLTFETSMPSIETAGLFEE